MRRASTLPKSRALEPISVRHAGRKRPLVERPGHGTAPNRARRLQPCCFSGPRSGGPPGCCRPTSESFRMPPPSTSLPPSPSLDPCRARSASRSPSGASPWPGMAEGSGTITSWFSTVVRRAGQLRMARTLACSQHSLTLDEPIETLCVQIQIHSLRQWSRPHGCKQRS